MNLRVTLPKSRLSPGILTLTTTLQGEETVLFTAKCLGRADTYLATQANNPTRNPILPCGNTPTGEYDCTRAPAGAGIRSYGPFERIALTPTGGQALQAKLAGRAGLMIHGGAPGNGGGLRPTEGCLRLSNTDIKQLLDLFLEPCTLTILEQ